MGFILDEFVLNVLEHHIEPIFDIVFSSARHFLDNFGPLISNAESLFEDENIFLQTEGILLDFWIEEIDPSFSALFAIPVDLEALVELRGNLTPLLGSVLPDKSD